MSYYRQDNITKIKTLYNVVLKASDNKQEQILFKVLLIFLLQHVTGQTLCNIARVKTLRNVSL